jgi:hypothetical protein
VEALVRRRVLSCDFFACGTFGATGFLDGAERRLDLVQEREEALLDLRELRDRLSSLFDEVGSQLV